MNPQVICFERRFPTESHEGQQGQRAEKKPEKSHLRGLQSQANVLHNNVIQGTGDSHQNHPKDPLKITRLLYPARWIRKTEIHLIKNLLNLFVKK